MYIYTVYNIFILFFFIFFAISATLVEVRLFIQPNVLITNYYGIFVFLRCVDLIRAFNVSVIVLFMFYKMG